LKRLLLILPLFLLSCNGGDKPLIVGSKKFTESVILGEIVKSLAVSKGTEAVHKSQLGGTRILWNALLKGEIDIYVEYTGTLIREIFNNNNRADCCLDSLLLAKNIGMSKPLGFNNTYALGMKREKAEELNIKTISDLRNYPDLVLGLTNEFIDRGDGWKGLKKTYGLVQNEVKGIDHDLAYRGLNSGSIDVIDIYSTDAEIEYYDLILLKDDKQYFTRYEAVLLYNLNRAEEIKFIDELEGLISEKEMINLNKKVKIDGMSESEVAAVFLKNKLNVVVNNYEPNFWERLIKNTGEHLLLVIISMIAAILISIPLGIISFYNDKIGKVILGLSGILQTIPSLALLVFMIPLFGIGTTPAIFALFLYSLLPIVRNTYLGFKEIPAAIRESAEVLGLSKKSILLKIEFPLALSSILAGIKTSVVINIGTATLGALIGAGGYGQPILTGIRLDNVGLILEGAVPAALMAIFAQMIFDLIENKFKIDK